jgi:hypothetical protein
MRLGLIRATTRFWMFEPNDRLPPAIAVNKRFPLLHFLVRRSAGVPGRLGGEKTAESPPRIRDDSSDKR